MAEVTDLERLVVELSADVRSYARTMERAVADNQRRTREIERQFNDMNRNATRAADSMARNIRRALAAAGVGIIGREALKAADSWSRYENLVSAAGIAQGNLNDAMNTNVDIAKRSRSELGATVELYARILRSTEQLRHRFSQADVGRATEIVNKAFVAGGASPTERAAATLQLSQGLASGILQGDELRSIRENAPLLAKAIADEFGVTIGELKRLGAEGKLTTDRLLAAILAGGESIETQFKATRRTVGDAFTNLRTETTRYVATMDDAVGASDRLGGAIDSVAMNIEDFGNAAIVVAATVGGVLAGRAMVALVSSMAAAATSIAATTVAMSAATGASVATTGVMVGLRAAMTFLGGPWVILITGIATAFGLFAVESLKARKEMEEFQDILDESESLLRTTADLLGDNASAMADLGSEARDAATWIRGVASAVDEIPSGEPTFSRLENLMALAQNKAGLQGELDRLTAERSAEQQRLNAQSIRDATRTGIAGPTSSARLEQLENDIRLVEARIAASDRRMQELADAPDSTFSPEPVPDTAAEARQRRAEELQRMLDVDEFRRSQGFAPMYDDDIRQARARVALEEASVADSQIESILAAVEARRAENEELDYRRRALDTFDRLSEAELQRRADSAYFNADLSRLRGDDSMARSFEREGYIRDRQLQLVQPSAMGPGLDYDTAYGEAAREAQAIDDAELQGRFRQAFRGGIIAALNDDTSNYLRDWVQRAWERAISRAFDFVADAMFSWFSGAFRGLGGGAQGGLMDVMGFAGGGGFTVGGAGGTDSQLRALALTPGEDVMVTRPGDRAGGGDVNISVHNETDGRVDVQQKRGAGSSRMFEISIRRAVADTIATGGADKSMQRFGLTPRAHRGG
jgi:tape measure domain-containing protein